ncbi:PspC domain-containing protein [Tsukamurella sp. 1534]|uniref:PspC domain-containing protein n=1 Tax=Tsukamurella sp. 1534 TaxID=1151061 RepID=UPI0003071692|nr:PspC domain-containing protein [Tsukamurella sp. 1534]
MDTATLSSQTRQMWDTRPLRARHAPIAGVCTGFARRYQVDVALVRAAVIGATVLGGIGFFAYLAAIFLLPKEPDRGYAPQERQNGPPPFVLIIAAILAVTLSGGIGANWPGAGLISAVLLAAGWYALYQRTPTPPPGTAVSTQFAAGPASVGAWQPPQSPYPWQPVWQPPEQRAQQDAAQPTPHRDATQDDATDPAAHADPHAQDSADAQADPRAQQPVWQPPTQRPTRTEAHPTEEIQPPRWDPLGAAPFAWDLPEPAAQTAPATLPKQRSRVTAITLGAALLTAAGIAAVNLLGVASISAVPAAAMVLGVVGIGLVFGAFRRSGYGLLLAAIPLAGFVVIGTTAQNVGFSDAPRGDQKFTVVDPATLRDAYTVQVGDLKLDLRDMALDRDRTVTTRVAVGDTTITVPESMNVKVVCTISVGDADCPDGAIAGKDAAPGAPTLTIDAQGNVGSVEVKRVG